jgi:hypothetical protein
LERPHKGFKGLINYASNTPRANGPRGYRRAKGANKTSIPNRGKGSPARAIREVSD